MSDFLNRPAMKFLRDALITGGALYLAPKAGISGFSDIIHHVHDGFTGLDKMVVGAATLRAAVEPAHRVLQNVGNVAIALESKLSNVLARRAQMREQNLSQG
jgi:hypothetical protein